MFKSLPSQKASLHQVIKGISLDPIAFDIVKIKHPHLGEGEAVKLKKSEFYFEIYGTRSEFADSDKFFVRLSPGTEEILELESCYDWAAVLRTFERFLILLRREVSVVDPWENAKKYADELHGVPQTAAGDDLLRGKEKDSVQKTLEEIKQLLLDHVENDDKKQQYLTAQFKMLNDAITKFGKKDYLMLVYTAIIGVITTIGVTPEIGSLVMQMLNGLLSHLPPLIA